MQCRCHRPCNAVTHAMPSPLQRWRPHDSGARAMPSPHAALVPTHAQHPPAPEGATHCSSPPGIGGSLLCRGPRSLRGPGSSSSSPRRPPAGQRERRGLSGDQHPQRLAGAVPGVGASRGVAAEPGFGAGSPYLARPLHGPRRRLAASRQSARRHHNPALCGIRAGAGGGGKGRENKLAEAGAALGAPRDVGFVPWDGAGAGRRGCSRSPHPCNPLPAGREVPGPGVPGEAVPCPAAIRDGNRRQAMEEPRQLPTRDVASRPGPPVPTHAGWSRRVLCRGVRSPMDPHPGVRSPMGHGLGPTRPLACQWGPI